MNFSNVVFWVVQITLVTLKLFAVQPVASWSWWAVLIPLWVSFGVLFVLLFVFGAFLTVFKK